MNPYVPLLTDAVATAGASTRTARETIYRNIRETVLSQLSRDGEPRPERLQAEMERFDGAIETIETGIEQKPASDRICAPEPEPSGDEDPRSVTPREEDLGRGSVGNGTSSPRRRTVDVVARLVRPLRVGRVARRVIGIVSNPYFLMGSLLAGVYVGLSSRALTLALASVADLYVESLKMVLIPFMVSAVVVSFSRLFGSETTKRHLGPIFGIFLTGLTLTAAFGAGICLMAAPGGNLSGTMRQALGQVINHSAYAVDLEVAINSPPQAEPTQLGSSLLDHLIPDNIFRALTAGDNLKILFFAVAFGVALGSLHLSRSDGLRVALVSTYDVCAQLIAWVNMLLPVALCGMVAKQVATVGTTELLAMLRFTVGYCLVATMVCLISIMSLAWASRSSFVKTLRAIREPLLLAMATRSSVTCIPAAVTSLTGGLGYDTQRVQLLLPLGVTLFRFGPVLYYAFTTVFVAQLYSIGISPVGYIVVVSGSILTGLASAGTTGVLTISLLGIIFQPLGLPLEAALALLVTVDPVIDIFRTACIVLPNCAAVAIVYRRDRHAELRAADDGDRSAEFRP